MKYLINESQFDNVIFKYLDNQDFVKKYVYNNVYFVNSRTESIDKALITYLGLDGQCFVRYELLLEISDFFSIGLNESKKVISLWIEKTLQEKVSAFRLI
jgi:hypothetical protein